MKLRGSRVVNPPLAPDPQGMTVALTALATANIFRDMSGQAQLTDLLKKLSDNSVAIAGAAQRAASAGQGAPAGQTPSPAPTPTSAPTSPPSVPPPPQTPEQQQSTRADVQQKRSHRQRCRSAGARSRRGGRRHRRSGRCATTARPPTSRSTRPRSSRWRSISASAKVGAGGELAGDLTRAFEASGTIEIVKLAATAALKAATKATVDGEAAVKATVEVQFVKGYELKHV